MFIVSGQVKVFTEEGEDWHTKILRIARYESVDRRAQRMWTNMRKKFPGETISVSVWRLDDQNINDHDGSLNWGEHFYSMRDIKDWYIQ
jgi:hypothetical protein